MKVTRDYENKLEKFTTELKNQLNRRRSELYPDSSEINVSTERGYKFDKIIIGEREIRYMIEISTQTIYGCKSAHQINKNWNFGTLENFNKWNWGGFHPEPIDSNIQLVSKHGPYKKYKMKDK